MPSCVPLSAKVSFAKGYGRASVKLVCQCELASVPGRSVVHVREFAHVLVCAKYMYGSLPRLLVWCGVHVREFVSVPVGNVVHVRKVCKHASGDCTVRHVRKACKRASGDCTVRAAEDMSGKLASVSMLHFVQQIAGFRGISARMLHKMQKNSGR